MQFSVVIPAKNEETNLERCLDSLNGLDFDPEQFEVVVVDNGSTDRTVLVAGERGARVIEAPRATIAQLRNLGAENSSGEIIAFLDADCAVSPGWLKAAARHLDPGTGVVAFGSPAIVPDGGTWVQQTWFLVRGKPNQVVEVDWLESANLMVRRSAFAALGGFNETLVTCEDYDLTSRLKTLGKIISDHQVQAVHYREPATVSQFIKKEMWRSKSNYQGVLRRKVPLKELPSLVLPLAAAFVFLSVPVLIAFYLLGFGSTSLWALLALLAAWEMPLLLLSLRKCRREGGYMALKLLVLLNAYFLARGLAAILAVPRGITGSRL